MEFIAYPSPLPQTYCPLPLKAVGAHLSTDKFDHPDTQSGLARNKAVPKMSRIGTPLGKATNKLADSENDCPGSAHRVCPRSLLSLATCFSLKPRRRMLICRPPSWCIDKMVPPAPKPNHRAYAAGFLRRRFGKQFGTPQGRSFHNRSLRES